MVESNKNKEWMQSLETYSKLLVTPEHIKCVYEFAETLKTEGLNSPQGKKALQTFVSSIAKAFRVNISDIKINDSRDANGTYIWSSKKLEVSENYDSIAGLICTIYHEMRHALQFQILRYGGDEFGQALKTNMKNYELPGETAKGYINYQTNLTEQDAELFAYMVAEQVISKFPEGTVKNEALKGLEKEKQKGVGALLVTSISKQAIETTEKEYGGEIGKAYVDLFFKSREDDSVREQKLNSELPTIRQKYAKVLDMLNSTSVKRYALKYIFDHVTIEEIMRNLDSPQIYSLINMESEFAYEGPSYGTAIFYSNNWGSKFEELKRYRDGAKKVLDELKIPYDKNDDGRMFRTFLDFATPVYAKLFKRAATGKDRPEDKEMVRLIQLLHSCKLLDRDTATKFLINKYGQRKINSWYHKKFNKEKDSHDQYYCVEVVEILGERIDTFKRFDIEKGDKSNKKVLE